MLSLIQSILGNEEKTDLRQFLNRLHQQEKRYLLRNDIAIEFAEYCVRQEKDAHFVNTSSLGKLLYYTQEIILGDGNACLVVRPQIAHQEVFRITDDLAVQQINTKDLLDLRDRLVNRFNPEEGNTLEIDFNPFYDYSPNIRDPKNIGKGVQFLNRYLSSQLFQDTAQGLTALFEFLSVHAYNGMQLLINGRISSTNQLSVQVKNAIAMLDRHQPQTPFNEVRFSLQDLGFEAGWGNNVGRIKESLELLDSLIDSPDDQTLEIFLSRIPMIFRIALVSVHGWFGQEGVLGRPDTGGQVVYVLDQAKNLERQLQEDIALAGLEIQPKVIILSRLIPNSDGTTCDQRLEKVYGTDNTWILRVPFREFNASITQNWISRFDIWPYLETYAIDAQKELLAEFQGKPDLFVGNYSDGNLVAFLLARQLKVTHCTIAHALEKSKYLFSNLYWQDLEDKYHFSLQFTVDLLTMNSANFVLSSSYQEIVGTPDSVGQYESYKSFTMPDLYHVINGIELFSPKFNIVPPGVNEAYFFPYSQNCDRLHDQQTRLEELLFTLEDDGQVFGKLDAPSKRPLFSMARLDHVKNLTGLAECFGKSPELQERCNLILIAGKLRTEDTSDREEAAEIVKLYDIINQYNLHGKIRWLGVRLSKTDTGEVYRLIADRKGIFVQPALFEAFGLTVLESMVTGLPTFATMFGGPQEIIQNGVNGFHINPTQLDEMAEIILNFIAKCEQDPQAWQAISENAIARVYTAYTWKIHTTRLLSLARIYGFWNHTSHEKREDLLRYVDVLFHLLFKPRAKQLLAEHSN
ncbi:sucrose synthase [Pseudanabaena mucicola]|uniref:Sucrose synthase n=1 Tax=Pseudanabaena mucicola FACHB-723 TaxID=2692860 RepID=A0ABR7ZYK3_9CYAN|nr:sucrose synthase [Pseudanabaena mucicola]MBD2188890.1 sucrose synthase [Pseudanabaena mucicola FACHB-723]